MSEAPSKSQVKKAGSSLRKFMRGELTDSDITAAALDTVQRHRAAHQRPLVHANNGLRSMARTARCPGRVTQRLKRMATILNKLERESSLALDKMQDIGGCRAVLTCVDDLWRLRNRIVKFHPEAKESDYITNPRASGYRGVHLVVEYGPGEPKPIEIQLRTESMHGWAMFVETYSGAVGTNYKQDGTSDFQTMARVLAEIFALDEMNQPVPARLIGEYNSLRLSVFPPSDRQE